MVKLASGLKLPPWTIIDSLISPSCKKITVSYSTSEYPSLITRLFPLPQD